MPIVKYFLSILLVSSVMMHCSGESASGPQWIRDSANPVLTGSGSQITDISDPCVLFINGKYRMWASCVEQSAEPDKNLWPAKICYSESADGRSWSIPIVVFTPSGGTNWDGQKTEIPTVVHNPLEPDPAKRYRMWYGGASTNAMDLTRIGLAYSADGTNWTRLSAGESPEGEAGLVLSPSPLSSGIVGDVGVVSDPSVVYRDGTYFLWYNSFGTDELVTSLATSADGIHWTKFPNIFPPLAAGWEASGTGDLLRSTAQPCVVYSETDSHFLMVYGAFSSETYRYSGLGLATSTNAIHWTRNPNNPILTAASAAGEELGIGPGPALLLRSGQYQLFFTGVSSNGQLVINRATQND